MKTNIQKKAVLIALSVLTILAFALTSCKKEQVTNSTKGSQLHNNLSLADVQNVISSQKVSQVDYVYLLGEEPLEGPDKTVAPNGDTIIIAGSGTLSIHAKSATGNGWFQHVTSTGTLLASGTWEALELISFKSFGTPGAPFPPEFEGGLALIRIHLSPDAGGAGFDAILKVYCVIAGVAPPGFDEGIRLVIQDVINFNKQAGGQTLFIRQ
ncbi:MAG TPA: hypothetical protein VEK36_01435 [Candidatus Paceibacterota bacterium]|nr:hypothetical protein [Candidatus Paceibacterota bacterium]